MKTKCKTLKNGNKNIKHKNRNPNTTRKIDITDDQNLSVMCKIGW